MTGLRVESLTYRYDDRVTAVEDVSLVVRPGEAVAVIGPNGAGKTTLVQHFNGMLRPSSGRVLVGGRDTAKHTVAQLAATVGFVFQNPSEQLHARTVAAEVRFGPKNLGFARERMERLVAQALADTGLTELADTHPYNLSLTQRKLVAIASVLAMDTPIVVLDEFTTGGDFQVLGTLVADLVRRGRTVVAVTHDMDFCAENFERVVLVSGGRIAATGTPGEVFMNGVMRPTQRPQLMRLADELGWQNPATTVAGFVDRLAEVRS